MRVGGFLGGVMTLSEYTQGQRERALLTAEIDRAKHLVDCKKYEQLCERQRALTCALLKAELSIG